MNITIKKCATKDNYLTMNILTPGNLCKVTYFECPAQSIIPPLHIQEENVRIELLTDGVGYIDVGNTRRQCTAGTIIWNIPGEDTIHETEVKSPYRCYAFHFKGGYCGREVPRVSLWTPADSALTFGHECLESFHSSTVNREYLANYIYMSLLFHAMKPQASVISYPFSLNRILSYINKHLESSITPDDIARACNVSRPHLFALFQKYLQTSPHQYLLNVRMTKAKSLLCIGKTPIKSIADQCCFNSLEVFYRQFRKNTGLTPAEYRHRYSR